MSNNTQDKAGLLTAQQAEIDSLKTEVANLKSIIGETANIKNITATNLNVNNGVLYADTLEATSGYIANFEAANASITDSAEIRDPKPLDETNDISLLTKAQTLQYISSFDRFRGLFQMKRKILLYNDGTGDFSSIKDLFKFIQKNALVMSDVLLNGIKIVRKTTFEIECKGTFESFNMASSEFALTLYGKTPSVAAPTFNQNTSEFKITGADWFCGVNTSLIDFASNCTIVSLKPMFLQNPYCYNNGNFDNFVLNNQSNMTIVGNGSAVNGRCLNNRGVLNMYSTGITEEAKQYFLSSTNYFFLNGNSGASFLNCTGANFDAIKAKNKFCNVASGTLLANYGYAVY